MTRPGLLVALLCAASLGWSQPGQARDLASIRAGGQALLAWLVAMRAPLDTIVAHERRDQLRRRLRTLSRTLFGTEHKIAELVQELGRPDASQESLNRRVNDLNHRVEAFREALLDIGPLLREEHRSGGAAVESALDRALMTRAAWVRMLSHQIRDPARRPALVDQGNAARRILREANTELASRVARLR